MGFVGKSKNHREMVAKGTFLGVSRDSDWTVQMRGVALSAT